MDKSTCGHICSSLLLNIYLLEILKQEILKRLPTLKDEVPVLTDLWAYYIFLHNQNKLIEKEFEFTSPVLSYVLLDVETNPYLEELKPIFVASNNIIVEKFSLVKDEESFYAFLQSVCEFINKLSGRALCMEKTKESQLPS